MCFDVWFASILNYLCIQMTASLVGAVDLHRYTQVEWDKATSASKADVEKAQRAKDKAEKDKEAFENRCAVLESEKSALVKAVEEAKAAKDEAVATAASLRSEQERLARVAKKAEEKIRVANSERDSAVRALEEDRALATMREKVVREEVGLQIIKYGMTFRRSALFMVKEKYPDLDFFNINFSDMKGHDNADPPVPKKAVVVQPIEEVVIGTEGAQWEIVEGVNDNITPESGENNTENVVAISSE